MDQPASALITVVIPAFNVGPYIRRCVASLLQQTHHELEVIVVNDASVDDTAAILDGLMAADSRLQVHHLPRNIGVHAARALGLRSAAGAYVGFVDSDDWVAPRMYETLCGEAVRADADIVVCGATTALSADHLGSPKVRFRRRQVIESNLLPRFCRLEFGSGVLWNKLYSSELVRPFAFLPLDRNVDAAEDYIVNIGCFARSRRVVTLPESFYYYFERPESASRAGANARGFCRVLRAYTACIAAYAGSLTATELSHIGDLYARQLGFASYWVSDPADLEPYRQELQSILRELADVHPCGIYPLVHAFEQTSGREMLKGAVRKLLAKARGFCGASAHRKASVSADPL